MSYARFASPHRRLKPITPQAKSSGPFWPTFAGRVKPLAMLRPTKIGRGWRYSIAMTNRNNHLLRDLRGTTQEQ